MNSIQLIGRLTADPTVHDTDTHQVTRFRIAVNRPGTEQADFLPVVTFGSTAKAVAEHLSKGRGVAVTGRLQSSDWTDREGQRRYTVEVVAASVEFLGRTKAAGDEESAA